MKRQVTLFFTALQFYTRIPIPDKVDFNPANLSPATRFLPLVGWIVGGISAAVWLGVSQLTSIPVAIICAIVASILTTGALHEDGFADSCDGFGGGWTREKILLIMKDSRIGTYGALGLICILALKFALLQLLAEVFENQWLTIFCVLITAHAISRLMPAFIIYSQPYARDSDDSKSKPVAQNFTLTTLIIAALFGIVPLLVLCIVVNSGFPLLSIAFLAIITWAMNRYFVRWISGYTGDCLGAVQQVCEVAFYFFLAALWRFI